MSERQEERLSLIPMSGGGLVVGRYPFLRIKKGAGLLVKRGLGGANASFTSFLRAEEKEKSFCFIFQKNKPFLLLFRKRRLNH